MGKLASFIKSPLGMLLLVVVLIFLYSRWRAGLLVKTSLYPASTISPVPPSPGAGGFVPLSPGGIGNP